MKLTYTGQVGHDGLCTPGGPMLYIGPMNHKRPILSKGPPMREIGADEAERRFPGAIEGPLGFDEIQDRLDDGGTLGILGDGRLALCNHEGNHEEWYVWLGTDWVDGKRGWDDLCMVPVNGHRWDPETGWFVDAKS